MATTVVLLEAMAVFAAVISRIASFVRISPPWIH
jgi:hypothetical protein